jgi:hypothetical protein
MGTYLTVIIHRDRNRRCLHPVATYGKAEPRVQSRAGASHNFVLLLHSRGEHCLHWYVHLNSLVDHMTHSVISGLIAFRIWRTQRQTRDAKMGANLSHVSIIVIESGTFKTFFSSRGAARVLTRSCWQQVLSTCPYWRATWPPLCSNPTCSTSSWIW